MNVNVVEWRLSGELKAGHDHSAYPEENDVVGGDERGRRIEGFKVGCFFRPAQSAEGPKPRTEPCVQNILVLLKLAFARAALGAGLWLFAANDDFAALLAIPGRDAVAPPNLAAHAPVADVFHPARVCVFPLLREKLNVSVFPSGERLVGHRLHFDKPLVAQIRLDDCLAAVAVAHRVDHLFFALKEARFGQVFDYQFARGFGLKALVFLRNVFVEPSVGSEQVDHFQIVALSHFPVVGVVGRSDFYHSGSKLFVNVFVGDDRNFFSCNRKFKLFSYKRRVALVCRVHGHCGVAKESFGAGCGHLDFSASVGVLVVDVVHRALRVLVVNFVVGQGGSAAGAPVDQALSAIHKAALVKGYKNVAHGLAQSFVVGKALALPVGGVSKLSLLFYDYVVVLFLYFPSALQKGFASKVVARLSFFFKLALHDVLRRDSGVVRSGKPKGVVALHAVVAHHDVLQCVVKAVAHVQDARYVGRRNHHGIKGRAFFVFLAFPFGVDGAGLVGGRLKAALAFPVLVYSVFKIFWIVGFF